MAKGTTLSAKRRVASWLPLPNRAPDADDMPPALPRSGRDFTDRIDDGILLSVLSDVSNGDFSVRMPLDWTGVPGKIADRLNEVITANQSLGVELMRVSRTVGKEGQLSQRVALR